MAKNLVTNVFALMSAIFWLVPGICSAQALNVCGSFALYSGDDRSVEYLDHGAPGAGRGDVRAGRRSLRDADGNEVGYHRWVLVHLDTVAEAGQSEAEYFGNHVLRLENGDIYYQILGEAVSSPDETDRESTGDYTGVVVGGTGVFRFARGTVERAFGEDGSSFSIDIRCD